MNLNETKNTVITVKEVEEIAELLNKCDENEKSFVAGVIEGMKYINSRSATDNQRTA